MGFRQARLSRSSFLGQLGGCFTALGLRPAPGFAAYQLGLPSHVVRAGDPGYQEARQDDNARLDFHPGLIAYCQSPDDVALCVRWAARNDAAVAIRSGGHDYEGFSLNNGGLVVDLSGYTGVTISPKSRTAWIRAGTTLGTIYGELAKAQATLPGGASSPVGAAGLTTGGGYGLMVRRHGMMCDRLRRVKMVDARGRVRDSATDPLGADVLWACRGGGGGSFGVVTDLEFDLVDMPEEVAYFSALWSWDDALAESLLSRWFAWSQAMPRELTSVLTLAGGHPKTVRAMGLFLGDAATLRPMLDRLQQGTRQRRTTVASLPYIDAMEKIMGAESARQSWKMKSSFGAGPLSAAGVKATVRQFAAMPPAVTCLLEFDAFGAAVNDVRPSATAFPHRDMTYLLQYQTYWNHPAAAPAAFAWARDAFAAIDPYTARKSYRNYCDLDLSDWRERYFAGNYARLQAIKAELDPDDRFRFPQSIDVPPDAAHRRRART